MKISQSTLSILKNFSVINKSLWIDGGSRITTISPVDGAITAVADVDDAFPSAFGIYDLPKLLNSLSIFNLDKCDVVVGSHYLTITEGSKELLFGMCEKKVIAHTPPEDMEIEFPQPDIEFDLPSKIFSEATKFLHILGLDSLSIVSEGGKIYIKVITPRDSTSNYFKVEVGETDKTFNLIFKGEVIDKLIDGDYHVSIVNGLTRFVTGKLSYYVAPDANSEYN